MIAVDFDIALSSPSSQIKAEVRIKAYNEIVESLAEVVAQISRSFHPYSRPLQHVLPF